MKSFEQLCDWLHAARPEGTLPQWGAADGAKVGFWWSPGRSRKPAGVSLPLDRVVFLGSTNRCYRQPNEPMDPQESWITWAGLDIDWEDQMPELRKNGALARQVAEVLCDELGAVASLRTSCGGRGLHALFRLSAPIPVPVFPVRGAHTAVTRHVLRPWREALEAAGVRICKDDSRMFWLWGGCNEWFSRTDRLLSVDPRLLADVGSNHVARPVARDEYRGGEMPAWVQTDDFVRGWLERLQVRPGLCYVGTVIHKLRSMGETVVTASRMSGDGRPNGYVDIAPGKVALWTYADGATIWCAEDVERLIAAMMGGDGEGGEV